MTESVSQLPTVVELKHSFFKVFDDPYFRTSAPPNEQPVFCATLGDQEVSLPLPGIARELKLEESDPLKLMLDAISMSLRFVNILRPGDEIPAEVRTGEASWEAAADHLEIARQRLTMQLVTWVSGRETMITDPAELQQLFEDPATKAKVNNAFDEAAQRLGLKDKDELTDMVEGFATELAYIEALREKFGHIKGLFKRINELRKNSRDQNAIIDEMDPVIRLMRKPVADFQAKFDLLDAQTGEIMTVLNKLEVERQFVRDVRDELYTRFGAWQEIVDVWEGVDPLMPPPSFNIGNALRDLYRFLAQRYMEPDEWVLMTSLKDTNDGKLQYGGVMVW